MSVYYRMRAVDVDSLTLTYRSWVVVGAPDYAASQYTGPKSGGSPLADVTVTSQYDDGGIPSVSTDWSQIASCMTNGNPTTVGGNFTVGIHFRVMRTCRIIGVKFFWSVTNKSVKISVWNASTNARLTSDTSGVTTVGIYSWLFTTPQTLTPQNSYAVSAYETDAASYTAQTSVPTSPSLPFMGGPFYSLVNLKAFGAGDAFPSSTAGAENYPVEPILLAT